MASSWTCSAREDASVLKSKAQTNTNYPNIHSIGFLIFAVGNEAHLEARKNILCLQTAFGHDANITLHRDSHLSCTWDQHGTPQQKLCWAKLMREKVLVAIRSPYDLTIMIDTDVYPNIQHKRLNEILPLLKSIFSTGITGEGQGYDIGGVYDTYWWTRPRLGHINGGWLIYRKNEAVDRFFTCVVRYMDANPGAQEQSAYTHVLDNRAMRSIHFRVFPPEWSCRGSQGGLSKECVFIHNRGHRHSCSRDT